MGGRWNGFRGAALALALATLACAGEPAGPEMEVTETLTVDASKGWAYVKLGSPAAVVQVADRAASTEWDLAFNASAVMLNGGAAGPGGVAGHCICQNAAASSALVQAMTPASELAAFEAVTAAQIPAAAKAWQSDALAPAITGWYSYDPATHAVSAAPTQVWKLRAAEPASPAYAKFRVVGIAGATQSHAGRVTFEYAVQAQKGAPMGETATATVDVSGGRVYFDVAKGAVSEASDWDLVFEGWTIRTNGGVSGSGSAGAVRVDAAFESIQDAGDLTASHYKGDAFGGVFDAHRWYRYNLTGTDHQIWPVYNVYLMRRGGAVYKVQLTGYYGETGEARHITLRYARIEG